MPVVVAAAALLGLAIGSFLNVVIARVPAGQSLITPSSRCPRCQHAIRARHNVPVLGWLMLRGRCHDCALPIGTQYPLVELVTAELFVLAGAGGVVRSAPLWLIAAQLVLAAALVSAVGIAWHAVNGPSSLTRAALVSALGAGYVAYLFQGMGARAVIGALVPVAVVGALLAAIAHSRPALPAYVTTGASR